MTPLRKKHNKLSEEIRTTKAEINVLNEKLWGTYGEDPNETPGLERQLSSVALEILKDEKLLKLVTWEVSSYESYDVRLDMSRSCDIPKELKDLFKADYHESFQLEDGIRLSFNDNDLCICFDKPERVEDFVKEHELTVDKSGLVESFNEEKKLLAKMESLLSVLKNV